MGMTVNAMAGMQAASETVSDYSVTAKARRRLLQRQRKMRFTRRARRKVPRHHIPSTR